MPTVSNNIDASVGATLIITPPSILDQWKKEIAAHAPGVKGKLNLLLVNILGARFTNLAPSFSLFRHEIT